MKLVRESIEFKRGLSSKKALNIGMNPKRWMDWLNDELKDRGYKTFGPFEEDEGERPDSWTLVFSRSKVDNDGPLDIRYDPPSEEFFTSGEYVNENPYRVVYEDSDGDSNEDEMSSAEEVLAFILSNFPVDSVNESIGFQRGGGSKKAWDIGIKPYTKNPENMAQMLEDEFKKTHNIKYIKERGTIYKDSNLFMIRYVKRPIPEKLTSDIKNYLQELGGYWKYGEMSVPTASLDHYGEYWNMLVLEKI